MCRRPALVDSDAYYSRIDLQQAVAHRWENTVRSTAVSQNTRRHGVLLLAAVYIKNKIYRQRVNPNN